jgi:hypothetical protein
MWSSLVYKQLITQTVDELLKAYDRGDLEYADTCLSKIQQYHNERQEVLVMEKLESNL